MSAVGPVDVSTEAKAITKALRSMLAKAKAAGFDNVSIYFESEGSVNLMNEDHPASKNRATGTGWQAARIGHGPVGVPIDMGGW